MHLLAGVAAHIFLVAFQGVFLFDKDTQFCGTDASGASAQVLTDLANMNKLWNYQIPAVIVITCLANIGVKQDKVYRKENENDLEKDPSRKYDVQRD